jgi:hypothetical protein
VDESVFPARLAQILETTPLEDLERDYFTRWMRTIFVVPGMTGLLVGDLIAVCGRDRFSDLAEMLSSPLPTGTKRRQRDALLFRDWQCVWPQRPAWLTPETFSVNLRSGEETAAAQLRDRLASLRSLLGVLFLARRSRRLDGGRFEVNFGNSPTDAIKIVGPSVSVSEELSSDLLNLYRFSYDGSSTDKLEIVRQLLSPARNFGSLCRTARNVLQAAEKTHGRYLKKKVDEYFEARRKTRDYVQEAVQQTVSSNVKMTQDVAESVYKTFGAVALVIVAQALNPDLPT